MQHIAYMKKSFGFLPKIISGKKTIESRWYATKRAPWGTIAKGDTVYFKNAGEPVTVRAKVSHVISFSDLTPRTIRSIINQYGTAIGIEEKNQRAFFASVKNKNYCVLVFLKKPKSIRPFTIDKTGFGAMTAWISTQSVKSLSITRHHSNIR